MLLGENQIVDIFLSGIKSLEGDTLNEVSHSFATTFSPIYSTPNKVRAIASAYLKDFSDEIITYLIHKFSVEADNISICSDTNIDKWGYNASLWVTYNVVLNAVFNSDIYLNEFGKKTYKKLGDFSISKDPSSVGQNPIKGLMEKLECDIFKLAVAVKFCKTPLLDCKNFNQNQLYNSSAAMLVKKGENLEQPLFGRTFYTEGRHPGWTGIIKGYDRYHLTNAKPYVPFHQAYPSADDPTHAGYQYSGN